MLKIWTRRSEDTFRVGQAIGKLLGPSNVVCLYGDLGAGKTVLAQGIGSGLEVKELINSPTFTIINQYRGRLPFYHLDLYRLEGPQDLDQLGWEEFIFGDGVAVVEWPEKLQGQLPDEYLKVSLEKVWKESEESRCLTLEGIGTGGQELLEQISLEATKIKLIN